MILAIVLLFMAASPETEAQGGIIYRTDGTEMHIDSFCEVSVRLVYNWRDTRPGVNDPGEYFRNIPVPDLKEISFVKQNGRWSAGFYYRVRIAGYVNDSIRFEEDIPAWDWLDMSYPGMTGKKNTSITFFHQKRKIKIKRIDFE